MRTHALGRVCEVLARDADAEASPVLADAVQALLFGVMLNVPPARVFPPTPIELACRDAAETAVASETVPHTYASGRVAENALTNDDTARRDAGAGDGPSPAEVEALVRLAAARAAAPAGPPLVSTVLAASPPSTSKLAADPTMAPPRVVAPAPIDAHATRVVFGEGGADATVDIAHPVLGPIRLEISLSSGAIALRALTPSTATATALRALEPTMARALTGRGFALRSLRVDVGSGSHTTVSRAHRRRRDFEEEA